MAIDYTKHEKAYAACVYDELRGFVNYIICSTFNDIEGKLVSFRDWTYVETNHRLIDYSAYDLTNQADSSNLPNLWSNGPVTKVSASGEGGEFLFVNPNQIRFIKRITPEQAAFVTGNSSPQG